MADLRGGTTISGYLALHTGNFNPTTDNVATATKLKSNRLNFKGVTDDCVVGQLMWKNYGNGHTIIDASAGTAPDGTAINNTNPANGWAGSYPTLMGWNGISTYGVRVEIARYAEYAATPVRTDNSTAVATTSYVKAQIVAAGDASTYAAIAYNGLGAAAGQFDGGATAPTAATRINYGGYLYATRVYNAYYNDYAEYFLRGKDILEPGDICMLDPSDDTKYIRSNQPLSKLVVGVVSDDYAQCIGGEGGENDNEKFAPIGMSGRVRVKVIGDVKKGDLLVSSDITGVAMTLTRKNLFRIIKKDVIKHRQLILPLLTLSIKGVIIGKALESHTGENVDRIKILIMNG